MNVVNKGMKMVKNKEKGGEKKKTKVTDKR